MKKLIAAAAVLLCCFSAKAQVVAGAGYSHTTIHEMLANVENGPYYNNNVYAELGYDLAFNRRTSILATVRGGTYFGNSESARSICNKDGQYYLRVPVYGKYVFAADSDLKLFLYLGPEFNYTLSNSGAGEFAWRPSRFNRENVYIGGGIGGDIYRHLRVRLGYEWGLLNEYADDLNGNLKCHSTDFTFGVSYVF